LPKRLAVQITELTFVRRLKTAYFFIFWIKKQSELCLTAQIITAKKGGVLATS
jgi:hypothetical protein